MTAPLTDSDGYVEGARDRAMVLDYYAAENGGACEDELPKHRCWSAMKASEFFAQAQELRRTGLLNGNRLTLAGLAALDDIAATPDRTAV